MKSKLHTVFVVTMILISGCENSSRMKFDKVKWTEHADIASTPPYRNKMLTDLIENQKLKGIRYDELINLLGKPNAHDSMTVSYDIVIDYGYDIDPVYLKYLAFDFSKDSIVAAFHVVEWKKGQD